MGTWKTACTVAIAMVGPLAAAVCDAADQTGAGRSRADVFVPLSISPETARPQVDGGAESSAGYRLASDCPPQTWRWIEPKKPHAIEFSIATALIIRIERDSVAAATTPKEAAAFAFAAEEMATRFRIPAAEEDLDVARDRTAAGPQRADAHPTAEATDRVLLRWETFLEQNASEAAAILAGTSAEVGYAPLRVTVTVARERALTHCAAIEVCDSGSWTPGGHRAETIQRRPLAPAFYGPHVVIMPDPAAAEVTARGAMRLIGDWLRREYAQEATAGALLANTTDPCAIAATVTPPRDSPPQLVVSGR